MGRKHVAKKAAKIVVNFTSGSEFARVGFSSGGRDGFLKHWLKALEKKSWVPVAAVSFLPSHFSKTSRQQNEKGLVLVQPVSVA